MRLFLPGVALFCGNTSLQTVRVPRSLLRVPSICRTKDHAILRHNRYQYRLCLTSSPDRPFLETSPQNDATKKDPFDECWAATSWTVNGHDDEAINDLLRCFNSPAPQAFFALHRALNNNNKHRERRKLLQLFSCMLKREFRFVTRSCSRGEIKSLFEGKDDYDCDLEWTIMHRDTELTEGWRYLDDNNDFRSTLDIAHQALDLVTEASEMHQPVKQEEVDELVTTAIHRLEWTLGQDIRGRTSADAAFCFAMAGVTNPKLYDMLTKVAKLELVRIGKRPSFPSKNILQIVEKLAAAGLKGPEVDIIYEVAANYLQHKDDKHPDVAKALRGATTSPSAAKFGLHSDRPLLWLWRFATRQSKVKVPKNVGDSAANGKSETNFFPHWIDKFDDPTRPLIVDVGCGMGVSLLGLATSEDTILSPLPSSKTADLRYTNCNLLGGDLSRLAVGYGGGIAQQWNLEDRLQFVCQSAESLLQDIQSSYPGPVPLIMIQFPTPFRLRETIEEAGGLDGDNNGSKGNSQLPDSAASGFMASAKLLRLVSAILKPSNGRLLLQSNCEDVAVVMQDMASSKDMACLSVPCPVISPLEDLQNLPQRTQIWVQKGGERAIGPGWSSKPLLPRIGQTETEVACGLFRTPVHRCVLGVGSESLERERNQ